MGVWEILLIIACLFIVFGVLISRIIKRKKGISCCDCGGDCNGCPSCCSGSRIQSK